MKKAMKQSAIVSALNIASVALLLGVILAVLMIVLQTRVVKTENENRFNLTFNANRFMNGSSYLTSEVRAYASTAKREHYDNYWNEINTLKNRDIGVQAMKDIGITDAELKKIEEMSALSNKLVPLEEQAMKLAEGGNTAQAIESVFGASYAQEIAKIATIKQEFLTMLDTRMQNEVKGSSNMMSLFVVATMALAIIIVLLQVATSILMRRKIIRPIIAVQEQMQEISNGNLSTSFALEPDTSEIGMLIYAMLSTKETLQLYIGDISDKLMEMADGRMDLTVDMDYKGDFSPIKHSMTKILQSLNSSLLLIKNSSVQVSDSSGQVSHGSQALSHGAVEQSSSIDELAATIADISAELREAAQNTEQVNQKIALVGNESKESDRRMRDMLSAMQAISASSHEIGKIIKTIEDIAFQTNILALNAAVEAARAGVAGKGFAVVADEVRNLASKSAAASKGTSELIASSLRAVDNGTKIADDTATSLQKVAAGIDEVASSVSMISKTLTEQAESVLKIDVGIEQISTVVQTNSATAEESAAASEELSAQAQMLKGMVEKFRLRV